jgi:nucleotide-binding universal stress UspA family protein
MPVFFGTAGLSADLTVLKDPNLLLLTVGLITIATIGKFGGAFIGAELGGLNRREAMALATGMNARGSTEVIVATIGLSMGALNQDLFTMIVTMAILTTLAMPPTLRWALIRVPIRKEEQERLDREALEARGFVSKLERLLVAVDASANGKFGARVAGMIAGTRSMPTTVMQVTPRRRANGGSDPATDDAAKERAEATAELLKDAAQQSQQSDDKAASDTKPLDVTVIPNKTTDTEAIAAEAEKGYDLLVIGMEKTTVRDNSEFHVDVTRLAAGFSGPIAVVDARDGLLKNPQDNLSILVPVNGTETSRRAAEVAIAMARACRAPVTALYVAWAESSDVDARTAVRKDTTPDDAIRKEMAKGGHNIVVMGVERRPGERLFFGETAAAILEKSDRSILFVAS